MDVVWIHNSDRDEQPHGEQRHNPAGESSLRGERSNEPAKVDALADALGNPVEHLRGVTTRLALNRRHERDLQDVAALHPLSNDDERLLDRRAELLVSDHAAEL